MFCPPGDNSQYIPLKSVKWSWSGSGKWDDGWEGDIDATDRPWSLQEDNIAKDVPKTGENASFHPVWKENYKDCYWQEASPGL